MTEFELPSFARTLIGSDLAVAASCRRVAAGVGCREALDPRSRKRRFLRFGGAVAAGVGGLLLLFAVPSVSAADAPASGEAQGTQLAFPGAEGYGRLARGGRGGRVIEVTNLEDSGPGSLREACDAEGPRTVVFRVGGAIRLKSKLVVKNPYIT